METWQGTTTEEQLKTIMLTSTNKLNLYILLLEKAFNDDGFAFCDN